MAYCASGCAKGCKRTCGLLPCLDTTAYASALEWAAIDSASGETGATPCAGVTASPNSPRGSCALPADSYALPGAARGQLSTCCCSLASCALSGTAWCGAASLGPLGTGVYGVAKEDRTDAASFAVAGLLPWPVSIDAVIAAAWAATAGRSSCIWASEL